MSRDLETHEVDADRLKHGEWSHDTEKLIGEGDIVGSYSGDRIGMGQPIRRPFTWRGELWVCTSIAGGKGPIEAEAYRLIDPDSFKGAATTYVEKTRDAEAARADPMGFYHGVAIVCRGRKMVLAGPPVWLIPSAVPQAGLFDGIAKEKSRSRS